MSRSAEYVNMKNALLTMVVPKLRKAGFEGTFPHFRKQNGERSELISFLSSSQQGGGFEVGASIIFHHAERPEDTNLFYPQMQIEDKKLIWADGRIRYGLDGMYDRVFYYVDLYAKEASVTFREGGERKTKYFLHYNALTPSCAKWMLEGMLETGYKLVQKVDETIYEKVAAEVCRQLLNLFLWFEEMRSIEDLREYAKKRGW